MAENEVINNEQSQSVVRPEGNHKSREQHRNDRPRRPRTERAPREAEEFEKIMVDIRSVQKTVRGGRVQSFRALCIVGDKKGRVGIGVGKAREAINAIEKGFNAAKKNVVTISMDETTIPHDINSKYGASSIRLIPAKKGTGVIAGGAARPVLQLAGIKDVTSKILGSSNKINTVKATFNALCALRTREDVAKLRGKATEQL